MSPRVLFVGAGMSWCFWITYLIFGFINSANSQYFATLSSDWLTTGFTLSFIGVASILTGKKKPRNKKPGTKAPG
jgi:hypothetical protein